MGTKGRPRAIKAQAVNEDQPQLATAVEITELRQVVQQQAEMIQKQAEEAKYREEELTRRQNQLFDTLMQRFPIPQGENRTGPAAERMGPEVRVSPPQPQQEPGAVAPGLKPASEQFMKRNPSIFEGTVDPSMAEE